MTGHRVAVTAQRLGEEQPQTGQQDQRRCERDQERRRRNIGGQRGEYPGESVAGRRDCDAQGRRSQDDHPLEAAQPPGKAQRVGQFSAAQIDQETHPGPLASERNRWQRPRTGLRSTGQLTAGR